LRRHKAEAIAPEGFTPDDRPARPDAVLFNGGALTPAIVRDRLVNVVASWFADQPGLPSWRPRVLTNASLDLAVAYGAAYYGVVRRGGGIRIGGGTARSYYVGFESDRADTPWLCVVPRDAQEGDVIPIAHRDFDLLMGQPVAFPLASSSVRADDKPGDLVADSPDTILALPPLTSLMRVGRKAKAERVPVRLASKVTEVGTVELWCESRTDDRRWRLQIQLRGPGTAAPSRATVTSDEADRVVIEQSEIDAAVEAVKVVRDGESARGSRTIPPHQAARGDARRAAGSVAALGFASVVGAASRPGRRAASDGAPRVALVQPRGLLPAAGDRISARRGADQGALARVSPGGEARQGSAMLGGMVDHVAPGRGRFGTAAPRRDRAARCAVPAPGEGRRSREESEPAEARGA
jgi:hypothetical protein